MGDVSWPVAFAPRHREEPTPWYLEEGLSGMRAVVDHMQREARGIESRVRFTKPVVERFDDDEGAELTFVVVDVLIPEALDGIVFRDRLFRRLVRVLAADDRARLAVGVGRLSPHP